MDAIIEDLSVKARNLKSLPMPVGPRSNSLPTTLGKELYLHRPKKQRHKLAAMGLRENEWCCW